MKREEFIPALIGLAIAIAISYGVLEWRASAPIEFYQRHASRTEVQEGDVIRIEWKEVRRKWCDSIVYRRLIAKDGSTISFDPFAEPPKPVDQEISGLFDLKIPTGLRQGPLIYRVRTEFRCNWVQRLLGGHIFIMPDIVFDYRRAA